MLTDTLPWLTGMLSVPCVPAGAQAESNVPPPIFTPWPDKAGALGAVNRFALTEDRSDRRPDRTTLAAPRVPEPE